MFGQSSGLGGVASIGSSMSTPLLSQVSTAGMGMGTGGGLGIGMGGGGLGMGLGGLGGKFFNT